MARIQYLRPIVKQKIIEILKEIKHQCTAPYIIKKIKNELKCSETLIRVALKELESEHVVKIKKYKHILIIIPKLNDVKKQNKA